MPPKRRWDQPTMPLLPSSQATLAVLQDAQRIAEENAREIEELLRTCDEIEAVQGRVSEVRAA